jgi:hypothetical protein
MYVSLPGENKFVKKSSSTYEESILKAAEARIKILRRQKKKIFNYIKYQDFFPVMNKKFAATN